MVFVTKNASIQIFQRLHHITLFHFYSRSFSPTPGALEYHPGKDYYFISTSSKGDLHLKAGGMCRSNNMKLVFKVADASKSTPAVATVTHAPAVRSNDLDNQVTPVTPPPSSVHANGDDLSDDHRSHKKERRRRRKKQKEQRQRNKIVNHMAPPQGSELSSGDYDNAKTWRQKEPGYVEKVNNLMKQEASIGGISHVNAANVGPLVTSFWLILFSFIRLVVHLS